MSDGNTDYWSAYMDHLLEIQRQKGERFARELAAQILVTGTERSGVSERREGEATFSTFDEITGSATSH